MSNDPAGDLEEILDANLSNGALVGMGGVTYCNVNARLTAQALGFHDFDDESLLADDMIEIMVQGGPWEEVDGAAAALHALDGGLAFAAMLSSELRESHGHLAPIYPRGTQRSASLQKDVPWIANVGAKNGIMLVSAAFPVAKGEPHYYARTQEAS